MATKTFDLGALSPVVTDEPIVRASNRIPEWTNSPVVGWVATAAETGKTLQVGPIPEDMQAKILVWVRTCARVNHGLGVRAVFDEKGTLSFATKPYTKRTRKNADAVSEESADQL